MGIKPNYMVIGASKCGTTTVCDHLALHPDVFMVECKEPQFFSCDEIYKQGLDWYESLYSQANEIKMRGEGSNFYTMKELFPKTISRITSYTTNLKLIYCVRSPIPRMESYWLEIRAHGAETVHYDFNTAIKLNRDRLVDSSNYWQQINEYRKYFSDNDIHIIFFEDLITDPVNVMRRCFEFLNVDPDKYQIDKNHHSGKTAGRNAPRILLSKMREHSLFRSFVKLIPESIRAPLKHKLFFKPITGRPEWNTDTRKWVADTLGQDTNKFLDFYGKPANFWKL